MYNRQSVKRMPNFYESFDRKGNVNPPSRDTMQNDAKNPFKGANLQEIFLNNCRKNENNVRIELLKGDAKEGRIIGFDSQSVILSDAHTQYLIYKSAITAVIPAESVQYIFNEINKKEYISSNLEGYLHI